MGKAIAGKPLNVIERREFRVAEATIEQGQQTFLDVGNALAAISEGKLYRESHRTFSAYIQERWGFTKSHAYRLIEAASVVNKLVDKTSPIGDKITTEAQARELGNVPEEQRGEVLEVATDATDGHPTAGAIRDAYAEVVQPEPPEEETIEDRMKAANAELSSFARRITDLIGEAEEIDNPHLSDEKHSRLETLKAQLRSAAATVRAAKGAGVCPYCEGKWCRHCLKTGWVTKTVLESAPETA